MPYPDPTEVFSKRLLTTDSQLISINHFKYHVRQGILVHIPYEQLYHMNTTSGAMFHMNSLT